GDLFDIGRPLQGGRITELVHRLGLRDAARLRALADNPVEALATDCSRADAVDANPVPAELHGQAAHEAYDAHLGGAVWRPFGPRARATLPFGLRSRPTRPRRPWRGRWQDQFPGCLR